MEILALVGRKRLEYLRAFLRFCVEAGWVERNPTTALKLTKVAHKPTLLWLLRTPLARLASRV